MRRSRALVPAALLGLFGAACLNDLDFARGAGAFCDAETPCFTGFYCDTAEGLCVAQRLRADPCARDGECASGHCATGVCCDSACAGRCASCAIAGTEGSCTDVPEGEDPFDDCPGTTACGTAGTCEAAPRWSRRFGLFGDQRAVGLAASSSRIALTGTFENAISFGTTTLTSVDPVGEGHDGFLAVLDLEGRGLWERALGGTGKQAPRAVAMTDEGIVVAGWFEGTLTVEGQGVTGQGRDVFVAAFDPSGSLRWLFAPDLPGAQQLDGVAFGANGEILAVGSTETAFVADDCAFPAPATSAALVLRLDAQGACRGGRSLGGTGDGQEARVVAAAGRELIVAGESRGAFSVGSIVVEGGADRDVFAARLDADDEVEWARLFRAEGDAGDDFATAIALDESGRPWLAGSFLDRFEAPGAPLVARGGRDVYVALLEADGPTLVDVSAWGDRYDDAAWGLATSGTGMVTVGHFEALSPFGAAETRGGTDGWVARLDGPSAPRWSLPIGGLVDDELVGAAVLAGGDLVVAGSFGRTITLGTQSLVAEGGHDVVVARLGP